MLVLILDDERKKCLDKYVSSDNTISPLLKVQREKYSRHYSHSAVLGRGAGGYPFFRRKRVSPEKLPRFDNPPTSEGRNEAVFQLDTFQLDEEGFCTDKQENCGGDCVNGVNRKSEAIDRQE